MITMFNKHTSSVSSSFPYCKFLPVFYNIFYLSSIYVSEANYFNFCTRSLRFPKESAQKFHSFKKKNQQTHLQLQGGSNMTGTNCDLFTHK
jgi:hypothetical protein